MARESIKLVRAALDESPSGDILLRGVLEPESFTAIKVAKYQRETLSLKQLGSLIKGFRDGGKIPDVVLGMRGGNYLERDGGFYLQEDTYVIDGLQRISAAIHCMRTGVQANPSLGAIVYFNTTEEIEKELFTILNTRKTKLSPNVLVRNLRGNNQAVAMLFDLCDDRDFVLYDRVSWQQNMRRQELLTSLTMIKALCALHSSFSVSAATSGWEQSCLSLENTMLARIGRKVMVGNTKDFFGMIDKIWGLTSVVYKQGATHLKTGFLMAVARMIAEHSNFWDKDRRLVVPSDVVSKLKTFPLGDQHVKALAVGTSPISTKVLSGLLVDHINSGKRTHRLVKCKEAEAAPPKKEKKAVA